jgi:hypothetical protein
MVVPPFLALPFAVQTDVASAAAVVGDIKSVCDRKENISIKLRAVIAWRPREVSHII